MKPHIIILRQDVNSLENEIQQVLEIIDKPEALVTDLSTLSDFGMMGYDNKYDAAELLKKLQKHNPKFANARLTDRIVDIAKLLKP